MGSAAFSEKVSAFFASEFANFGGRARVILNDSNRTIEVKWTKDRGFKEPKDHAMELLQSGRVLMEMAVRKGTRAAAKTNILAVKKGTT